MSKPRTLGRLLRIARIVGLGAVLLTVTAVGGVWAGSEMVYLRKHPLPPPRRAVAAQPVSLAEGGRLARIYGCTDCHGAQLQGRLFHNDRPIGKLYGPNLTRVAQRYSDDQLRAAITHGVAADGRGLWVMPASTFAKMGEGELQGIIGYIRAQPVGGPPTHKSQLGPLARVGMLLGKFHSEPELIAQTAAKAPVAVAPDLEAGRRLAAVACGECHGPALEGAQGPLNTPDLAVASAYSLAEFERLMSIGAGLTGRDLGLMGATARTRFSALSKEEVAQLHTYLVARARKLAE